MERKQVEAYINKLLKDRDEVAWKLRALEVYRFDEEEYQRLSAEYIDITAAISDCKSLLPRTWWERLLAKIF